MRGVCGVGSGAVASQIEEITGDWVDGEVGKGIDFMMHHILYYYFMAQFVKMNIDT